MRLTRHLTLWLVAACALGAFAASAASAELPEIGRCIKLEGVKEGNKTIYSGKFKNRRCNQVSGTGTGKFEWFPGTNAGAEEFENFGHSEPVTIESAAGAGVECKNHQLIGKYTGPTTETLEIRLLECLESTSKKFCTSEPPEGPQILSQTIVSQPLEGRLGYIKKSGSSKPKVGWEIKPKTGPDLFMFECGQAPGLGTKVTIEGAFIGQVYKWIDKMEEEYFYRYQGGHGTQVPEMLEGGPKATLTATFLNLQSLQATTEAVSYVSTTEEQEPSEALEIKVTP